jgi:hypothetical protein
MEGCTTGAIMAKKAEYKVVSGTNGFPELEKKVSEMLNQGWKPVGGIGFNSGFPYQAMARVVAATIDTPPPEKTEDKTENKAIGASSAMKALDELT